MFKSTVNRMKLAMVAGFSFLLAAVGLSTTATTYDLSTDIAAIKTAAWTEWLEPNAGALLALLGFFVGLVLVLKLIKRFGAKSRV